MRQTNENRADHHKRSPEDEMRPDPPERKQPFRKPYIGDLETAILKCRTMEDFLTVQKTVQMIEQLT